MRPVDVIVDLDLPESGFFSDKTMTVPYWTTLGVSQTFFGHRRPSWLKNHITAGHLVLDGEQIEISRRVSTDFRIWRLYDVERVAHALATQGFIAVDDLVRVIEQVRLITETWGYRKPRPLVTRIETVDPNRREVHAMAQADDYIDDLDGSPEASPRTFALGDIRYHIDLNEQHWNELVAALAPYIKIARSNLGRDDGDPALQAERAAIRAWAKQNGFEVGERGPIPFHVVRAYLDRKEA